MICSSTSWVVEACWEGSGGSLVLGYRAGGEWSAFERVSRLVKDFNEGHIY